MSKVIQFPQKINYRAPVMSPSEVQVYESIFSDNSAAAINRRLMLTSLMKSAEELNANLDCVNEMIQAIMSFQEGLNYQANLAKFALSRLEIISNKFQA